MRSSFQILKSVFSKILDNPKTFLMLMALPALIAAGASLIEPSVDSEANFIWTSTSHMIQYIATILVLIVVTIFMTIASIYVASNPQIEAVDAYKMSFKDVFRYIGMVIISTIILIISFMLFIIPGIWLSISLMFATYFLVLKNAGIVESLKMSFALVKGRWWSVLGKSLMFSLLYILCIIPVYIVLWVLGNYIGDTASYALESVLSVFGSLVTILFMYELFVELEKTRVIAPADTATMMPSAPQAV
jgi:hypothetical protein